MFLLRKLILFTLTFISGCYKRSRLPKQRVLHFVLYIIRVIVVYHFGRKSFVPIYFKNFATEDKGLL